MVAENSTKSTDQEIDIVAALHDAADTCHIPAATYRVQFHAGFTFRDVESILDYLHNLGISDLYASPIFLPRAGSTHGYDVTDPTQINPALGSEADLDTLCTALQQREMGLLLDVVPNHMGINDPRNVWWSDVLENGPSSDYAHFFDIQWHPVKQEMENKVLLPILGDQYGIVLESGQLKLKYESGSFFLTYYETVLPLAPRTYMLVLRPALEELQKAIETDPDEGQSEEQRNAVLELESILTALNYLPPRSETDPEKLAERAREKEIVKRRLATLHQDSAGFRAALEAAITTTNGQVGKPESFDLLDQLVDAQAYRLAFWRVAGEEINYRRFFDINDLAALRVEDQDVFQATHALAIRLLAEGKARGLRIDHPDGLYDPVTYFRRLQEQYIYAKLQPQDTDEADRLADVVAGWIDRQARQQASCLWPLYVVVEKILSDSEPLPSDWSVFGTTGYDFLASANNLFVETRHERAFNRLYNRFTGQGTSLGELSIGTKMMIMRDSLAGEINTLASEIERIGERNRHYRDFTLGGLRTALREIIACLSIYRTYVNAHTGIVPDRDRKFLGDAVRIAKRRHPLVDDSLFDYIQDTVLLRNMDKFPEEDRSDVANWVMKFQQLTGPVMAKGMEDTAFYIYNRLTSLNEVGGHPSQFGASVAHFHQDNRRRVAQWRHSMLATSTHDNKRSEDVRARISVLSEMPDLWQAALRPWSRFNASKKTEVDGNPAPDTNDEYLFYQTLLGAWPYALEGERKPDSSWDSLLRPGNHAAYEEFRTRIANYMEKATREAKVHTSWMNPSQEYDQALRSFVERVLEPGTRNRFLIDFAPMARMVAYYGQFNSLAQTLLKLTSPGVPDIYQGNELWDFSLVDPDNRRPVDYDLRQSLLHSLQQAAGNSNAERLQLAQDLLEQSADGRIKLYVTSSTLEFRRSHYELFTNGNYLPVVAGGKQADHLCAFLRYTEGAQRQDQALVVVPRLVATLTDRAEQPPTGPEIWDGTWLILPEDAAGRAYRNIYTGEIIETETHNRQQILPMQALLAHFPVALLTPEE
jgi:(1->4)-alpha-D-glucan 1-alpha-D-glucosylmutase